MENSRLRATDDCNGLTQGRTRNLVVCPKSEHVSPQALPATCTSAARATALFNYLYARHCGGKFVLRIEDTDRQRSTPEAIDAILESMEWLKLEWDEGPFYQTERMDLYKDRICALLDAGDAYPCVCTPETLEAKRAAAMAEKRKPMYDGTCRPAERAPVPAAGRDPLHHPLPFTREWRHRGG